MDLINAVDLHLLERLDPTCKGSNVIGHRFDV